ncbi:Protein OS-9 [Coniosporium apollinis]|uniref:Endoplasmic reticulum lectin n=1 Tax=Coniosporium apollinis TaxID=61459 RepID=A0ABQ9P7H5_9PEZI|nr:Protein OS-9 [Coniosporium apollinis]
MKNFWALPAFLRLALASQHAFSVLEDLLAHPQYEVLFPDSFVSESYAESQLAYASSQATKPTAPESQETIDLSHGSNGHPEQNTEDDGYSPTESYEVMRLGNQRYLCSIPTVQSAPQNDTSKPATAEEEQKELARASDRGWELLKSMEGNCVYFHSGKWWSYSFCYNAEVRQFHQLPPSRGVPMYPPVEDPSVHSFVLGKYPGKSQEGDRKSLGAVEDEQGDSSAETGVARLVTKGETRYMAQKLGGGTRCDLTGERRKIEVQFHCHAASNDRIAMIKEVATCSYLMVIYTPRLCNDVAFLPPQENRANAINCQPIVAEQDVSKWAAADPASREDVMPHGFGEERPIVGGIEIGAKKDVGTDGKVIEKSVIVGGGKENLLGTVAASDAEVKILSKDDLKKLVPVTHKDLEKLKRDVQKMAGDKGWRLELVDTPRGREFRGIIDADREDEDVKREQGDEEPDGDEVEGSEETYKEEL